MHFRQKNAELFILAGALKVIFLDRQLLLRFHGKNKCQKYLILVQGSKVLAGSFSRDHSPEISGLCLMKFSSKWSETTHIPKDQMLHFYFIEKEIYSGDAPKTPLWKQTNSLDFIRQLFVGSVPVISILIYEYKQILVSCMSDMWYLVNIIIGEKNFFFLFQNFTISFLKITIPLAQIKRSFGSLLLLSFFKNAKSLWPFWQPTYYIGGYCTTIV